MQEELTPFRVPNPQVTGKKEEHEFFNWHDILLVCNTVGLFCIFFIILIVLILVIVYNS